MKTFDEHWEEIEAHFNFTAVYRTMKLLDWTWGDRANASIPSVQALKKRAKELCQDAYINKKGIETGGFGAHYEEDSLNLYFTLESWETS